MISVQNKKIESKNWIWLNNKNDVIMYMCITEMSTEFSMLASSKRPVLPV